MSGRGGKRRQVLQLGSASKLHRYGYSKGFHTSDKKGKGSLPVLVGNYSNSDSEDSEETEEHAAADMKEEEENLGSDTPDTSVVPEQPAYMDDELKNFLSEIEAIPAPPETDSTEHSPAPMEDVKPEPEKAVEADLNIGSPVEAVQDVQKPISKAKQSSHHYSMFVKGESEFVHSPKPDTEDVKSPAVAKEEDIPDEPTTNWQMVKDENTHYYYYWNTVTNEVTWEIPTEYTQYLLLHREYEEKVAKYTPEQLQKRKEKNTKTTGNDSGDSLGDVVTRLAHPEHADFYKGLDGRLSKVKAEHADGGVRDTTRSRSVSPRPETGQDSRHHKHKKEKKSHHKKKHKRRHDDSQSDEDRPSLKVPESRKQNVLSSETSAVTIPAGSKMTSIVPYLSDQDDSDEDNNLDPMPSLGSLAVSTTDSQDKERDETSTNEKSISEDLPQPEQSSTASQDPQNETATVLFQLEPTQVTDAASSSSPLVLPPPPPPPPKEDAPAVKDAAEEDDFELMKSISHKLDQPVTDSIEDLPKHKTDSDSDRHGIDSAGPAATSHFDELEINEIMSAIVDPVSTKPAAEETAAPAETKPDPIVVVVKEPVKIRHKEVIDMFAEDFPMPVSTQIKDVAPVDEGSVVVDDQIKNGLETSVEVMEEGEILEMLENAVQILGKEQPVSSVTPENGLEKSKAQENSLEKKSETKEINFEKKSKTLENNFETKSETKEISFEKKSKARESSFDKKSKAQENSSEMKSKAQENSLEKKSKLREINLDKESKTSESSLEKRHKMQEDSVEKKSQPWDSLEKSKSKVQDNSAEKSKVKTLEKSRSRTQENSSEKIRSKTSENNLEKSRSKTYENASEKIKGKTYENSSDKVRSKTQENSSEKSRSKTQENSSKKVRSKTQENSYEKARSKIHETSSVKSRHKTPEKNTEKIRSKPQESSSEKSRKKTHENSSEYKSNLAEPTALKSVNIVGYASDDEEEEGEVREPVGNKVDKPAQIKQRDSKKESKKHRKDSKPLSGSTDKKLGSELVSRVPVTVTEVTSEKTNRVVEKKPEKVCDDDDDDIDFDIDDIDRALEVALEKKLEKKKLELQAVTDKEATVKDEIIGCVSSRELIPGQTVSDTPGTQIKGRDNGVETSGEANRAADPVKKVVHDTKVEESSQHEDEKLVADIRNMAELALSKLEFLDISTDSLSRLQVLFIELQTRFTDWASGGLSTQYFHVQLKTAEQLLEQYELSAVPEGWACQWDRSNNRYYYRNKVTNSIQWEYPEVDDKGDVEAAEPAAENSDESTSRVRERGLDEHHRSRSSGSSRHRRREDKEKSKYDKHSSSRHYHRKRRRGRDHSNSSYSSSESQQYRRHRKSKKKKRHRAERSPSVEIVEHMDDNLDGVEIIEPPEESTTVVPQKTANSSPSPPLPPDSPSTSLPVTGASTASHQTSTVGTEGGADVVQSGLDAALDDADLDGFPLQTGEEDVACDQDMPGGEHADTVAQEEVAAVVNPAVISKPPQIVINPQLIAALNPDTHLTAELYSTSQLVTPAQASLYPSYLVAPPTEQPPPTAEMATESGETSLEAAKKKKKDKKTLATGSSIMMKKKHMSSMVQKWQKVKIEVEKEDRAKEIRQAAIRRKIEELKNVDKQDKLS